MIYKKKSNQGSLEYLNDSFNEKLYGKEYKQPIIAQSKEERELEVDEKIKRDIKKKLQTNVSKIYNANNEKWLKFQKMIIINPTTGMKSIWDVIVIIMVFYSCYTSFFWASFWPDGFERYFYIEIIIEVFFCADMLINLLTSYVINEETQELTYLIADTSLHYIKRGFISDLIAVFPFNYIFPDQNLKITQLIRIVRFFRVTDENSIVEKLNRLIDNINAKNKNQLQYQARYMYRIFRFILIGLSISFFLSCIWYIYATSSWSDDDFALKYYSDESGEYKKAIISYYFILSTLATVGYGDYLPLSPQERIIAMIIMVCGVAFFSYIINNFNDIMSNYKTKLGYINKIPEVEEWLLSLNMESDKAMDRNLIKRIYDHFNYFYKHYRLASLTKDDKYFNMMSYQDKKKMIRHLFQDIFSGKFRTFFMSKGKTEFENYNFYIDIAFSLLPRKYKDKQVILQQGEEVEEMYFLIDGEIEVSFIIDDLKVKKYFTSGFQFGAVQILSNSLSNFTYLTTTPATLYVIKKQPFIQIFNTYPEIKQDIILNAFSSFRLTRKSMMEQFVVETKDKLGIQINEEETNYLFDIINKKLSKSKKKIIKSNLKSFTNSMKINEDDVTDSDSDSQDDISISERISDLQECVNTLNDKLDFIQPSKVVKQTQANKNVVFKRFSQLSK